MSKFKVLFQLTGSISCFKAAQAISTLVQNEFEVRCVATESALKFIGPATLEGLTGYPVFSDSFKSGQMMDHIHLARWADILVLCPATANTINSLAAGLARDEIGQIFLASGLSKPYLIFPAMNHEMFKHPAIQKALGQLKSWGVQVEGTDVGHQACGEEGEGRLLSPDAIVSSIKKTLRAKGSSQGLRILITGGGTREKIDGVRFIGNISSGRTASQLADYFVRKGHEVVYLRGEESLEPQEKCVIQSFSDFLSLNSLLKKELEKSHYDLIIHAAAVSDYSVSKIKERGREIEKTPKLNSDLDPLTLELKRNKKIINEIKKWAPKAILVAFKLTHEASPKNVREAVTKLARESQADLIVHNDFSQMKEKDSRVFQLFEGFGKNNILAKTNRLDHLAEAVLEKGENHDSRP